MSHSLYLISLQVTYIICGGRRSEKEGLPSYCLPSGGYHCPNCLATFLTIQAEFSNSRSRKGSAGRFSEQFGQAHVSSPVSSVQRNPLMRRIICWFWKLRRSHMSGSPTRSATQWVGNKSPCFSHVARSILNMLETWLRSLINSKGTIAFIDHPFGPY